MKFRDDRRQAIRIYILEKIAQNSSSISKTAAEAFNVNPSTIHAYLNELVESDVIRKIKRGKYELITTGAKYELSRNNGDLNDESVVLKSCLSGYISNFADNVKNIWNYAFSEMINNVIDHSGAESAEVVIEQNFLSTRVRIYDNGVGIFKKIQEYFGFSSADEAICELFKGKLTTDSKNHSGEGIFFSSKLMDEFSIISDGKIFTDNRYNDGRVSDLPSENQGGTCVIMGLSNFSRKTAKDVFDDFSDETGGFLKTIIPLKNIFDAAPVSRSQAKRVCERLDRFEEVIVDFEGVTWMGQGFAHQLFAVFAVNHPEIAIKPINMNEDTAKMFNHVMMTAGENA